MQTLTVTPEDFAELLLWLDLKATEAGSTDPARGALKYEAVRRRIIKIYQNRGCQQAEEVADEAFNRVCVQAKELRKTYEGDPALYIYAVAKNVYRELTRAGVIPPCGPPPTDDPEEMEERMALLDMCLAQLGEDERGLILRFYEGEKGEKIKNRKRLASELGTNTRALSLRALRIRRQLRDCMRRRGGRK
ncbi:MAG: hypothetical protein LC800_21840 [Acidobacteria bacterium]|nr:hypothetical protein [Acidobacteriota bacterium]